MGASNGTAGRRRGRRRRGASSGQALVEFGLVTLPFFVAFFGIIEFGLIMSSIGTYNFAVREAARYGSVLGRTNPNVDQLIINGITAQVQGLVMAQPLEIDIYRAWQDDGKCLVATSPTLVTAAVGDPTCPQDTYTFSGTTVTPTPPCTTGSSCTWPPDNRNDSLVGADYVGVKVRYQYTFLTTLFASFGSTITLSTFSVQRIEPQDYNSGQVPSQRALLQSAAAQQPLAAALPVWKQHDEGGGIG